MARLRFVQGGREATACSFATEMGTWPFKLLRSAACEPATLASTVVRRRKFRKPRFAGMEFTAAWPARCVRCACKSLASGTVVLIQRSGNKELPTRVRGSSSIFEGRGEAPLEPAARDGQCQETRLGGPNPRIRAASARGTREIKRQRSEPHSKTLPRDTGSNCVRQVLECGCPLPLSSTRSTFLEPLLGVRCGFTGSAERFETSSGPMSLVRTEKNRGKLLT
jgi:hypothetical protein